MGPGWCIPPTEQQRGRQKARNEPCDDCTRGTYLGIREGRNHASEHGSGPSEVQADVLAPHQKNLWVLKVNVGVPTVSASVAVGASARTRSTTAKVCVTLTAVVVTLRTKRIVPETI